MTSIIAALPPELLDRIISLLSSERKDVSACRLVCQTFKELASPYLITRVLFAQRLDTVTKLEDVLKHPYFSRYVTEMVYDASLYDAGVADDWNEYVTRCEAAPRKFFDTDWAEGKRRTGRMWNRLAAYSDLKPPLALTTRRGLMASSNNPLLDGLTLEQQAEPEVVRYMLDEDVPGVHDHLDAQVQRDIFRSGCHKGFAEYYERRETQDRMDDANLLRNMLPHILIQLPKLRTIHFTDFRGLMRVGENYGQCCRRLFRNTLEPDHLGGRSAADVYTMPDTTFDCWEAIIPVLEAVSASPTPRTEEFFIATNPYVQLDGTCFCEEDMTGPQVSAAMPLGVFGGMDEISTRKLAHAFTNLRRLDLPFLINDEVNQDFHEIFEDGPDAVALSLRPLRHILEAAAPTLIDLNLSVHGLDTCEDYTHIPMSGSPIVFQLLLSSIIFPVLQSLELAGFALIPSDLQTFLSKHQSSLCELRLLNNHVFGNSEELAQWGGKHLSLGGVRIANWGDVMTPEESTSRLDVVVEYVTKCRMHETFEALWLAGKPNRSAHISSRFEENDDPWWQQRLK